MEKNSWQKLHTVLIVKIGQFLKKENPNDEIVADCRTTDRPQLIGKNGKTILPDLINHTKKIV